MNSDKNIRALPIKIGSSTNWHLGATQSEQSERCAADAGEDMSCHTLPSARRILSGVNGMRSATRRRAAPARR